MECNHPCAPCGGYRGEHGAGQRPAPMKVLAVARPRAGIDFAAELRTHGEAELRAVWDMYSRGVIREMYSPGGPGIVLIMECADLAGARALLGELPLVVSGVIDFELTELHPFSALGMLFAPGGRA